MNKKWIIGIVLAAAAIAAAVFFAFRGRVALPGGDPGQYQAAGSPGAGPQGMNGGQGMPGGSAGQGGQGRPGAGAPGASYAMVRAAHPTIGSVSVSSSLTGTVAAADEVHVFAKASGDVTGVCVKAGDYVETGTLICEIDTDQVETAKNSLASAEVSLNNARSTLSRMQILYSGGDITDQEYEQYNNNVRSAQIQYDNAKLNYDRQVEYSSVTAPISGRIESCSINVYDHVGNNAELCVITGEGDHRIDFYVSERIMKVLSEGDPVQVFKNGMEYSGAVAEISTMVDSSTGMFKCKAELENTEEIAIGSSVRIRLVTGRAVNVMLVPVDAVYYSGSKAYVYLVEDGKAVMRRVEVGLYDSEVAEIKEGLNQDDLVVGTWSSNLYEGANVRVMNEEGGEADRAGGRPDSGASGYGGQGGRPANGGQ